MNSSKKILIYCDNSFQIMMAIHLKRTVLLDDKVDIIITDHINDYKKIYTNLKKETVFNNVIMMNAYDLDYKKNRFRYPSIKGGYRLNDIKIVLNRKKILKDLVVLDDTYDEFWATDILDSTNILFDELLKRNKKIKMVFYEESPVSLICDQHNQFVKKKYDQIDIVRKIIYIMVGFKTITGRYAEAYSSVWEYVKWNKYFTCRNIPKLRRDDKEYVQVLNRIWDYQYDNKYNGKIIFFEESFFLNGIECKDIQIVKDITDVIDKKNVIIKLHPRSRINRFKDLGIEIEKNSSIPWELIALNLQGEKNVLISIATSGMIHPKLYWGIDQNAIALAKCKEYEFEYLKKNKYYQEYINVCLNDKLVEMPTNKTEFVKLLKQYR